MTSQTSERTNQIQVALDQYNNKLISIKNFIHWISCIQIQKSCLRISIDMLIEVNRNVL